MYGFSWEVLIFVDFTYDFSWDVWKFTISTSHFMVCFEDLTKKVSMLCCVLRATGAKYCKIHSDFLKFQTVWCKSIGFELPRGGGRSWDGHADARRNNQLRAQPSGEMHENKFK